MAYKQSVIKEIKRKASDGDFEESVKIGAEQKFVSALLNSHNNNLEEQSILGSDCFISSWEDDNGKYIIQKFLDITKLGDVENGYYILATTDKSDAPDPNDYYFDGDKLVIPTEDESGATFDVDDDDYTLVCTKPDIMFFESITTDDQNYALIIRPTVTTKIEQLVFRTDVHNTSDDISGDILISTKTTKKRKDGQKFYTQVSINNGLLQNEVSGG